MGCFWRAWPCEWAVITLPWDKAGQVWWACVSQSILFPILPSVSSLMSGTAALKLLDSATVSLQMCLWLLNQDFPLICLFAVAQLNNSRLNANSTPQEVAGVMLSKAETGVTTTISIKDTWKNCCFQFFYKTWLIRLIFCTGEDPSDVARPYGLCDSTLAADQYRLVNPENTYNLSHIFLNIVILILMWAYFAI